MKNSTRKENVMVLARHDFGRSLKRPLKRFWAIIFMALGFYAFSLMAVPYTASANDSAFAYYSGEIKQPVDHGVWGAFLQRYVVSDEEGLNRVAYGKVTAEDRASLEAYIASLEAIDPTRLGGDEAFAYWVNLYNAVTVKIVLDHYPIASIRDIRTGFRAGPWKRDVVRVNGRDLSLDDIEHGILRQYWNEPRVHYAVNCASIGCPNLAKRPYSGSTLDMDLDKAASAYINSPRGVSLKRGRLKVSSLYRWFRSDFGRKERDVVDHLRHYAAPELQMALAGKTDIDSYEYDWRLNDAE